MILIHVHSRQKKKTFVHVTFRDKSIKKTFFFRCDECDNKTSDKSSVSNYVWKCFQIKKRQTGTNETEIYAEIDEAFVSQCLERLCSPALLVYV